MRAFISIPKRACIIIFVEVDISLNRRGRQRAGYLRHRGIRTSNCSERDVTSTFIGSIQSVSCSPVCPGSSLFRIVRLSRLLFYRTRKRRRLSQALIAVRLHGETLCLQVPFRRAIICFVLFFFLLSERMKYNGFQSYLFDVATRAQCVKHARNRNAADGNVSFETECNTRSG